MASQLPFRVATPVRLQDADLPAGAMVRDGDWREPLEFMLEPAVAARLLAARRAGLPVELAITLAIERALVLDDAAGCGIDPDRVVSVLEGAARDSRELGAALGPGQPDARYAVALQRLKPLPWQAIAAGSVEVLIPCRLHVRATRLYITDELIEPASLEQGRNWEIAAVSAGMLLGEWAKQQLLLELAAAR